MKTQCLYEALDRWHEEGGYLVFRKSTYWGIPHVLHVHGPLPEVTHYVPPDDLRRPWYSLFGFPGAVKIGDDAPAAPIDKAGVVIGAALLLVLGCVWAVNRTWRRICN